MVIKRFSDLTKKVQSNPFKNFGSGSGNSSEAQRNGGASEEDVGSGLDTPEANVARGVVCYLEPHKQLGQCTDGCE
jgi:hypothetical protein